jgi:tripartite-type tricarboxylate transporter receptor subunit TctC
MWRSVWLVLAGVLSITSFTGSAAAQQWPTKPITVVQGFPAGSGLDIVARVIQEPLEKALGQPIVFDYKVGAGGNNASAYVAKAPADGYTLLMGTAGTHGINAALYKKLPFDVEADFTAIAPIVDVPNVLTVNPEALDAKDLKDFIAKVKAQPGKFNYGSTGNGTSTHLGFAQLNAVAGLDMVHIPYKGSPEAIQNMIAKEICCMVAQVQTILGQWKAGKLRLLGVTTKERVGILADIPTISEAGLPGFQSVTWYGLFGPKGLDPAIVEKVNAAVRATLEIPAIKEKMTSLGNALRSETVAQFRETVKRDRAMWAEVVKKSGASID